MIVQSCRESAAIGPFAWAATAAAIFFSVFTAGAAGVFTQAPETPAAPAAESAPTGDWRAPFTEPITTDRPDFTESTSVLPFGRVQLEGGYTFSYDHERGRKTSNHTFPEFLLRSGIAQDVELRLGWEGWSLTEEVFRAPNDAGRTVTFHEHDDGGTDMSVGFKAHLVTQDGIVPEFGIIGAISLPTGAAGKTSGDVDPEIKLLWAYELTDSLGLAGNLNFAVPSGDDGRFFQTAASVSLAYSITDWLGTYVEYFGFYPNARDTDCAHYLNGGFTFPITDNLQFDVRCGMGLNEEADDLFTGVGFAFRF